MGKACTSEADELKLCMKKGECMQGGGTLKDCLKEGRIDESCQVGSTSEGSRLVHMLYVCVMQSAQM